MLGCSTSLREQGARVAKNGVVRNNACASWLLGSRDYSAEGMEGPPPPPIPKKPLATTPASPPAEGGMKNHPIARLGPEQVQEPFLSGHMFYIWRGRELRCVSEWRQETAAKLPLMYNIVDVVGLRPIFGRCGH